MTEHTKGPLTLRFNRPTVEQRNLIYAADACGWGDMFAERDAAVAKLKALQEENKRNYDKWWDYEQQHILPVFRWAEECGIDLPTLVMEGKGNSTVRFFEALRARLSELEMHNTEHHCGVAEIAKQRDDWKRSATTNGEDALRFLNERNALQAKLAEAEEFRKFHVSSLARWIEERDALQVKLDEARTVRDEKIHAQAVELLALRAKLDCAEKDHKIAAADRDTYKRYAAVLESKLDPTHLAWQRIDEWINVAALPEDHPIRHMQRAIHGMPQPEKASRPHEHDFGGAGQYHHCRTCGLTQDQARAASRPQEDVSSHGPHVAHLGSRPFIPGCAICQENGPGEEKS